MMTESVLSGSPPRLPIRSSPSARSLLSAGSTGSKRPTRPWGGLPGGRLLMALLTALSVPGVLELVPPGGGVTATVSAAAAANSQPEWVIIPDLKITTSNWGEAQGMELARAIDGDLATFYWSGREVRAGDWLELDLGAEYELSGVRFLMATTSAPPAGSASTSSDTATGSVNTVRPYDYVYSGQILVRPAAGAWRTVGELDGRAEVEILFPTQPVRYLRLRVTRDQVYWVQIREIQLLAPPEKVAGDRAYRPAWLKIRAAEEAYTEAVEALDAALARWDDVDTGAVEGLHARIRALLERARAAYDRGADDEVVQQATEALDLSRAAAALVIESRPAEVRAVWVDRPALIEGPDSVRALLDRLAKLGVNLIFPEMVWRGAAAFPSETAPRDPGYWRWGDIDPLAFITAEAHARGIQVAPWVWVFAAGYYHEFGPVLEEHPEWAELSRDGSPFSPTEWGTAWLNASLPEVRAYLIRLLVEIVTRYDVDGLHLDYIRFNEESHIPFGYSPATLERFRAETGLDARSLTPGTPAAARWDSWREALVTSFLEEAVQQLRQVRPGLHISAAVVPDPEAARRETHQNWPLWLRQGLVDFVAAMNYTPFPGEFWSRTRLAQQAAATPARILPGLGIWLVTPERMLSEIASARELLSPGVVLFAASTLQGEFYDRLLAGPFRQGASSPLSDPEGAWLRQCTAFVQKWTQPRAIQVLPAPLAAGVGRLAQLLPSLPGQPPGRAEDRDPVTACQELLSEAERQIAGGQLQDSSQAAVERLANDARYLMILAELL